MLIPAPPRSPPRRCGFSWAEDASDYVANDDKNAVDNLTAMQTFYELFPELKSLASSAGWSTLCWRCASTRACSTSSARARLLLKELLL